MLEQLKVTPMAAPQMRNLVTHTPWQWTMQETCLSMTRAGFESSALQALSKPWQALAPLGTKMGRAISRCLDFKLGRSPLAPAETFILETTAASVSYARW